MPRPPESSRLLDASALLAFLQSEPGADRVAAALDAGAAMSAVNLSEVVGKLADAGASTTDISSILINLDLEVVPFDSELAHAMAEIRRATRASGLSLGDRAAFATAVAYDMELVTADLVWTRVAMGVNVVLIR